jgi:ATP-dependent protease HslVU (ClpYQ) peptidase subunit
MTTLAAIQGDGWIVIGGDSQSSDQDGFKVNIPGGKIFENNGLIIGGAGDVRGINILQHTWTAPKVGRSNPDRFITRTLIPSMRKAFIDAGYEIKKDDSAVMHGNIFLVVIDCNLYRIEDDYSWERCEENLYVAGSGEALALGAMTYALQDSHYVVDTPEMAEQIIRDAIGIAAKWDSYTGGKITTLIQTK